MVFIFTSKQKNGKRALRNEGCQYGMGKKKRGPTTWLMTELFPEICTLLEALNFSPLDYRVTHQTSNWVSHHLAKNDCFVSSFDV